jgi:peptidoglycan/LPS O-acetylase OafA/YrhL
MKTQARNAIRSAIAVVAGYLTMAVLVMLIFLVLGIIFPKAFPSDGALPRIAWVIFILIWNLLAAIAGAYVTSLVCRGSRVKHVLALLAVVIIVGLIVLAGNVNKQPVWYLIAQIVTGVIGVMIGGSVPVQGRDPKGNSA